MSRDAFEGHNVQGGLTGFELTVTKSYFAEVDMSKEGNPVPPILMLHWEGTTNLDDRPILGASPDFHPSYGLAKDWVSLDGATVTHPRLAKNPKQALGSWYGRLIDRVVELTAGIANTPQDPLAGDATPHRADMWVGTSWQMDDQDFEFKGLGDKGKTRKLLPTKYLGKVGVTMGAAPVGTSAAAVPPAASNGVRDTLISLARASNSYPEFQAQALRVDGVTKDTDLLGEVLDENLFYAKARS